MTRHWKAALLASALLIAPTLTHAEGGDDAGAAIHDRVLVLDSHADVLLPSTPMRYYLNGRESRVDLPHLKQGRVDAIVLAVAVGPGPRDAAGVAAARHEADEKLARIKAFADSSRPQPGEPVAEHRGLSPLGKQAVAKLNDLGVLIDVSQLSTEALLQTLALSRAPVAATHSAARTLVDNGRNLSDAELDAIKAKGGVVQVTPFTSYLALPDQASRDRFAARP